MTSAKYVHQFVMDETVALLRKSEQLQGVQIVAQSDQDLATLITVEESQLDGVAAVVAVNTVEKIHSNPVKYRVDFSVNVTEIVPINRETPGFLTAIDVAAICGDLIDAESPGVYKTLRHSTPGDGILTAVAECAGEFTPTEEE